MNSAKKSVAISDEIFAVYVSELKNAADSKKYTVSEMNYLMFSCVPTAKSTAESVIEEFQQIRKCFDFIHDEAI